ncbi:MAG: four helix bundle protein [Fimbriimonadaceae bacterium]
MSGGFEKLDAFKISMDLAEQIYLATKRFPVDERFGLTSQIRRASCSVVSNIAEGYGRLGRGEYLKHLGYARGSACEVKAQLMIAKRIGIEFDDSISALVERQILVLNKLITKLREGYVKESPSTYGEDLLDNS